MFARGRNPEDNPNNLPDSREETASLREFLFLREMLRLFRAPSVFSLVIDAGKRY